MSAWKISAFIGATVGSVTGIATMIGINAAGFTSSGIAAGSIAAVIQSTIGNVGYHVTFATMTSIGMTSVAPLAIIVGMVAGLGAGLINVFNKLFKNKN